MLHEANAAKAMLGLIQLVGKVEEQLTKLDDKQLRQVNLTEMPSLMGLVTKASTEASKLAKEDQEYSASEVAMMKLAPSMAALAGTAAKSDSEKAIRRKAKEVVEASSKALFDLNEVECPRCGGHGQVGLRGTFCGYCGGSCFVTKEMAKEFKLDDLDEVDCPHCSGTGQRGLVGDICTYCKGDGFVTHEAEQEYHPDDIDEVDCPRCAGTGQIGRNGTLCPYCKGSCFVSQEKSDSFHPDQLDEVDCPHCAGTGQTGLVGDLCIYCNGDAVVTQQKHDDYNSDDLNEVECPHCAGVGKIGWNNELCSYCKGSCVVSREREEKYDPDQIDEKECPRCGGSGQQGWSETHANFVGATAWCHALLPKSTVKRINKHLLAPGAKTLFCFFDDTENAEHPFAPRLQDIKRILKFTESLPDRHNILVHCRAGVSRSTATAYAILCQHSELGKELENLMRIELMRDLVMPNRLIIRHADKVLKREGAMLSCLLGP